MHRKSRTPCGSPQVTGAGWLRPSFGICRGLGQLSEGVDHAAPPSDVQGKVKGSRFFNCHAASIPRPYRSPVSLSQLPGSQGPPHELMRLSSWTHEAGNRPWTLADSTGPCPREGPLAGSQRACPDHALPLLPGLQWLLSSAVAGSQGTAERTPNTGPPESWPRKQQLFLLSGVRWA